MPDEVFLVNFGALIPNMVVIPKGVAAFSLYFNLNLVFDENRINLLLSKIMYVFWLKLMLQKQVRCADFKSIDFRDKRQTFPSFSYRVSL